MRTGFVPGAGDQVVYGMSWDASTGKALAQVHDITQGIDWSHSYSSFNDGGTHVSHPAYEAYDGTNTNVIDERIAIGGGPTRLANYGEQKWFGAKNTLSTGLLKSIWDDTSSFQYWMTSDGSPSGTDLSHIHAIPDSASFYDGWHACS